MQVAHILRKSTQLRSSFIQNQIINHINFKPVIIYIEHREKNSEDYADFDNNSIPVLNLWATKNYLSRLIFKYFKLITKKDINRINLFLLKYNVDILHFHYGTDAGIYNSLIKSNKLPSVVSFYGYDCSGFPKRLMGLGKNYLKNRVFKFITTVIAMSQDMKRDIVSIGCPEEKVLVHYYGSEVKKFYINREYTRKEKVEFIIISGLEQQKGHLFLLESFKDAYKECETINLKIYGSGPLLGKIESFINKNEMHYVKLMGMLKYASKKHLAALQNADVFIHPSVTDSKGNKEGIPGSIVEAMAAGLPVISTYHAGIPDIIINNVSGLLVNELDFKALTSTFVKLSINSDLRKEIGQRAQKVAIKNFDVLDKEIELENIYRNLISDYR